MKRQIAKGLTMLAAIVGLALVTAVAANGQGSKLKANVPFDYIVADKTMRAAECDVRIVNAAGDMLAIGNADGQPLRLSHSAQRTSRELNAKLVFHRYGSTYFLTQVWMADESAGREFAKTKQEKAIERELKRIAAYRGEGKPVYEVVNVLAILR